MNRSSHRFQRGMTLLSILISMAIGIFLVGAVIKVYLDSKTSFNMRNAVAEVSENQRFALDDMRRILIMVGRDIRALEDQLPNRRPFPVTGTTGIVDGGSSGSDTIAIRYRRGPSCGSYQKVPLSERPTQVRFYVDNNNNLICEMTTYASGTATTVKRTMVSNVHMLKALYGVDDDGDGFANRYLTPTEINKPSVVGIPEGANTTWAKVVSMRIALLAGSRSELPAQYRQASGGTMKLLGLDVNVPDGDHLYRVATTTIALRNLHPTLQRQ